MTTTTKTLRLWHFAARMAATWIILLAGTGAAPLPAQEPAAAESAKPAEAAPTQASATPAAPGEGFQWGVYQGRSEIEVGYRWVSDIAGSKDMYRSMVNLGDGPKLLRSDVSLRSAYGSAGLFDRLDFSMYSWGGEPYNTLRFTLGRSDLYELRANYRNLNYFNLIPSYANPLLGSGVLLGQHSLNITYRTTDVELELFPNGKIRPYVGYSRATSFGPGLSTYSLTGNEFRLKTDWRHASDEYRGGVQVALPRVNFTVEQGYRFLRNDSGTVDAGIPGGNNPVPFLGRPITLDSQERAYHERTRIPVTKILAKARPIKALSITGRYIYSIAELESSLAELNSGSLISLENRLAYASAADAFTGRATRPNHRGNLVVEFTPIPRLKVINHFDTRNYHVSGSALLRTTFFNARSLLGPPGGAASDISVAEDPLTRLVYDQTRNFTEVQYEIGRGLTARGGYRYTSRDAKLEDRNGEFIDARDVRSVQDTALFGFSYRQARWLHLEMTFENNWTDAPLVRSGLRDYGQVNLDWRVNPNEKLSFNGRLSAVTNENAAQDIDFRSHYRSYTFAVNYALDERIQLGLDYGRSNILTDLRILIPQTLAPDRSRFEERTDGIGGSLAVELYRGSRLDFGYRGVINSGSYPLNFHQPFASWLIPVQGHFAVKTFWQYFGYNERGASLQDYRGHLVTFSILYRY